MDGSREGFVFGTCTVPDGKQGPWEISTFTITPEEERLYNIRCLMNYTPELRVDAGTYRRLSCKGRGVVMSNTPMEVATNREAFRAATGRVLINGLGLGMLLEGILTKPDVTYVRVIEVDQDVIDLVGPHFAGDPRVEIVHADALDYKPAKGEHFDFVWHDIWDDISGDNLDDMAKLGRRYNKRVATAQGWWSRDWIRRDQRRWR